jgi:pimeloyl-ACP methyl ester carboxylesterase
MMNTSWDTFWHKWLKRPYQLAKPIDSGQGTPVIMLHGIGRYAQVWQPLAEQLSGEPFRCVGFDLLGFGRSPKPHWKRYDVEDHAESVIASIEKLSLNQPIILVGHSLGALVAVHIAALRPELVKHLVLYEMPLFAGLPGQRRYRLRMNLYAKIYQQLARVDVSETPEERKRAQRIIEHTFSTKLDKATWPAYVKSLENAIVKQKTAQEVSRLPMPMDVVFGLRDRLVIRGKTQALFGKDVKHVIAHTIDEGHRVTESAAAFLAERIRAADSRGASAGNFEYAVALP